jgi:hypothetical protein
MLGTKANLGIGTAVVTTIGGIITAWIMHQPVAATPQKSAAPAVGHIHVSSSGVSAWVYDAPVEDAKTGIIGELSNGQTVQIVCTKQGPAQTGSNGTSTLWDKIEYNGGYGYVNDAEVNTNSDQAVAPSCPS